MTPASTPPVPFVHRITKYDPADRNEHGHYTGTEEAVSDHGPVEAAYLAAVAAFAEESGVDRLAVREPGVAGLAWFGLEPAIRGHGLAGLFPPDLTGFHDGAEVPLATALELVRVMLREQGAWCVLEAGDAFTVRVGWDQYVYVTSAGPCEAAASRTRALGLFPERLEHSPYDEDPADEGPQRPADADFWAQLRWTLVARRAVLLEEGYLYNASRWHRLTPDTLDTVRARLTPRALLTVWPDLSPDVGAVLAGLPGDDMVEFVWEDGDGVITGVNVDETEHRELARLVAGARAAAVLPLSVDERVPLLAAVLPDADGVLRARWRTEPVPDVRPWTRLKSLDPGTVCTAALGPTGPGPRER